MPSISIALTGTANILVLVLLILALLLVLVLGLVHIVAPLCEERSESFSSIIELGDTFRTLERYRAARAVAETDFTIP